MAVTTTTTTAVKKKRRGKGFFSIYRLKNLAWSIFRAALIFGVCFVIIYPILLRVTLAIRGTDDIYNPLVVWIPMNFTWDNFSMAMEFMNYQRVFFETLIFASVLTLIQTLICAISGYSFARLKFRGQGIIFALVIFSIVVPPQTTIISRYMFFLNFWPLGGISLINTYWPFIISSFTGMGIKMGLFIYLYRQFFRGMPKELEEAAMVDGAGVVRTFTRIIMPNATPMIVTVALFSFVWQWNDSYYATLFITSANLLSIRVLGVGAEAYIRFGGIFVDPNEVSLIVNAAVMLTITPLIIMYLFMQKYFVEGIERSGIVG